VRSGEPKQCNDDCQGHTAASGIRMHVDRTTMIDMMIHLRCACLQCGGIGHSMVVTANGKAYAAFTFRAAKVCAALEVALCSFFCQQHGCQLWHASHINMSQALTPPVRVGRWACAHHGVQANAANQSLHFACSWVLPTPLACTRYGTAVVAGYDWLQPGSSRHVLLRLALIWQGTRMLKSHIHTH
jgi:hypothetical protein